MYQTLAILAVFILIYSSVAGGMERTPISGPIIFTAFGVLVGPVGLGLLALEVTAETIRMLAELTLALVLFTDAAAADLATLRTTWRLPVRLLLLGLPLTILVGFGVGKMFFPDMSGFEVALLATLLAPTDAALGKGVVTNQAVPKNVRQSLSVESGLNDGICVPILLVFLALAIEQHGDKSTGSLVFSFLVKEIGIGVVVGLVLTGGAVSLLRFCHRRQWISDIWIQLPVISLAIGCFAMAQLFGGSGFIAAFVGGLLFGVRLKEYRKELLRAVEGEGETFALLTWVIFGTAVVGKAFQYFSWPILLYAVLSLTLIRMVPVFVSLTGLGVSLEGRLFMGWFGPRGLASIVFGVIVLNAHLPNSRVIAHVVVWTVILSILLHGVTANIWARGYGQRWQLAQGGKSGES
ncbi:cation:proton antiporter [Candidatus Nitrospira neomarina]|uniref:Cation:proton antiporter n=1 Tax=Candidatus Nitrospira neomarina TaxID=3020899 RepID=A0AA96K368_9BACT|nr:cation:proton antiporter [Candidatus Nitrospira neomarina]WNM62294.1 cation:proton antiporter [Candidatus Nitrospira neomarina]